MACNLVVKHKTANSAQVTIWNGKGSITIGDISKAKAYEIDIDHIGCSGHPPGFLLRAFLPDLRDALHLYPSEAESIQV